jgi:hypothetical protein
MIILITRGLVNRFLSWTFFAPLSRLTFCMYLIHLHIMFIFHFGRSDVMEFGQYLMVMSLKFASILMFAETADFVVSEKFKSLPKFCKKSSKVFFAWSIKCFSS